MIDKILSMFGLVRVVKWRGDLYPANNCELTYHYNGQSLFVSSAWGKFPSSSRMIVRKSTLALNQVMRCL